MSAALNKQTVFALTKWFVHHQQDTASTPPKLPDPSLKMLLRIESQDAWIFNVPMAQTVVDSSDFYIGKARCDNALASIFVQAGYSVHNPAFALRAIEVDSRGRPLTLYDNSGVDAGIGSSWVLFSDEFAYQ